MATRVTDLDYCILGLLQQGNMSGYQIRKMFEQTALASYSGSPGAIYPSLERLKRSKLIGTLPAPTKTKKLFHITRQGTATLAAWVYELPTREAIIKYLDMLLLKIAFMDTVPDLKKQLSFLRTMKSVIDEYVKELSAYFEEHHQEMPRSGKLVLAHGIDGFRDKSQWLKKIIKQYE